MGGVASYATWRTAQDTRAALERDSKQQEATQAWQVTYWEEEPEQALKEGDIRKVKLHVINRSLDPVPRWSLSYAGLKPGSSEDAFQLRAFSPLPPCTEVVLNSPSVFWEVDWDLPKEGKTQATFQGLTFSDTRGNSWTRDHEGTLTSVSEFGTQNFYNLNQTLKDSKSTMRPADDCGSPNGG
ncbi:hypothetical protein [Streptomyces sp. NPDC017993]|uniref:hypothetical protein n=1 Tax=Streptomyces sp. NPDC017993 TaxID=3365027 RepID=UPI003790BB2B